MITETAASLFERAARTEVRHTPLHALAEVAPGIVPVLYGLAEKTWPRSRESKRKQFGVVGRTELVREELPPRYRVLLRRYDLATLQPCWRLEAAGPVELFEWDDSGRVRGAYGFRYPVYSVCPVFDELGQPAGFGLNGRSSSREDGALSAIDARITCAAWVRSHERSGLMAGLQSIVGKPRVEAARPGIEPTNGYFDVLQRWNRRTYLTSWGINQYVGPGWTPLTVEEAFDDPGVRALWIADPSAPSATPLPQEH